MVAPGRPVLTGGSTGAADGVRNHPLVGREPALSWEITLNARGAFVAQLRGTLEWVIGTHDPGATIAIGRTGDPVAPTNFNGVQTNENRRAPAPASSSRLRFSIM